LIAAAASFLDYFFISIFGIYEFLMMIGQWLVEWLI
jgi:hypothetical protein